MDLNSNITLDAYSASASKQFDQMQSRLSSVENSFQTRMNGKTTGGIVGSLIGTIVWMAAWIACAVLVRYMVDYRLLLATLVAVFGLLLFMLVDDIMNFSYYGKIAAHRGSITQLQNRVSMGKSAIKSNLDTFRRAKAKGWNHRLNAAPSIPEEATSIESTMKSMESLKSGFVNGAKNFFFYAAVVMVTITGSVTLFELGEEIMTGFVDVSISWDTITILNYVALGLALVGVLLLAKLIWSKTGCAVNNITVLVTVLGPVAYLAVVGVGTLLTLLVVGLVKLVLAILAVVIGGSILVGSISGG